jgi:hypothetical protein
LTTSRIVRLLSARRDRRRRELQELGSVIAFAFHEPKEMDKLWLPTIQETLERAENEPQAWETDQWWGDS